MALGGDEATRLADVERGLRARFGGAVPEEVIARELRSAAQELSGARIRTYLPILLQRRVTESLRAQYSPLMTK